jgi:hypothetical protein
VDFGFDNEDAGNGQRDDSQRVRQFAGAIEAPFP